MEIPKAMIVERIRGRSGAEKDAELLRKYGLDPEELHEDFEGQPNVG